MFRMRNDYDGQTAEAHKIGETDDGDPIYQGVDGWTLESAAGQDVNADFDGDGNWIVSRDHPFLNP